MGSMHSRHRQGSSKAAAHLFGERKFKKTLAPVVVLLCPGPEKVQQAVRFLLPLPLAHEPPDLRQRSMQIVQVEKGPD